jgi:hypothetical protein
MRYFVLAADWHSGRDPVPYFGQEPATCLDFSSRPCIPRALLRPVESVQMPDCEHGVEYAVVICEGP